MKFAIIGLGGVNTFSRKMEKALKKLSHSVYVLTTNEIKNRYCPSKFKLEYHIYQKNPMDLREILPVDNYDMIIISHSDLVFNNPKRSSTKVLYYHREMLCYPSCLNPDILAYNHPAHDSFIWHYYPKMWHSAKKIDLPFAVDPEEFNPNREKDLTGLNYVSVFEDVMEESRDYFWNYMFKEFMNREKRFTSNGCRYNGPKYATLEEYKDYVERSEAFLVFASPGIYGTRRMFEIAACKSLPIIHIESPEALEYYKSMGFELNETCLMFGLKPPIIDNYDCEEYYEYTQNAYNLVLNEHTYDHRAKEITLLL